MSVSRELFNVNRDNKLPLYEQIAMNLRELILNENIKPGDTLPPELELAEYYGVSRLTVRKAMEELVRQKLLSKRQGIGTFVNKPTVTSIAPSKLSFTAQVLAIGREPGSLVISQSIKKVDAKISRLMQLPEKDPLVEIIRVRLADNVPILLEKTYFSAVLFPGLEKAENLSKNSLYDYLSKNYGMKITRIEQTLKPVLLTEYQAGYLQMEANTPSIMSESLSFTSDNRLIEYTVSFASAENCEFYFTFRRGE